MLPIRLGLEGDDLIPIRQIQRAGCASKISCGRVSRSPFAPVSLVAELDQEVAGMKRLTILAVEHLHTVARKLNPSIIQHRDFRHDRGWSLWNGQSPPILKNCIRSPLHAHQTIR